MIENEDAGKDRTCQIYPFAGLTARFVIDIAVIHITVIDLSLIHISKRLRVAAYCRVSTRSKEQQASLFRQIWAYMNQILNNPNWEFAGIFYDFGKSGLRKRGRTGLEKMLKQAEAGEVDYILTK